MNCNSYSTQFLSQLSNRVKCYHLICVKGIYDCIFSSVSQFMFDDAFSIIVRFRLISKLNFPPWILSSHHFPSFLNFFRMAYFLLLGEYGASGWSQGSKTEQIGQYKTLLRCDYTARFLNYKFRNAKVFGIEGCDSLLPG